ncbi:MAG: hypothetical protein HZR80_17985 [Candidatus Heimdallarchaeota archaeon]
MFKDQEESIRVILANELNWSARLLKIGACFIGASFLAFSMRMLISMLIIHVSSLPEIMGLLVQIVLSIELSFLSIGLIIFILGFNRLGNHLPLKNKGIFNAIIIIGIAKIILDIILNLVSYITVYLVISQGDAIGIALTTTAAISLAVTAVILTLIFLLLSITFYNLKKQNGLSTHLMISPFILPFWIISALVSMIAFIIVEVIGLSYGFFISSILFGITGIISCIEFSLNLKELEINNQ